MKKKLLLCLLSLPMIASAQWQPLGPDDYNNPSFYNTFDHTMTVDNNGNPIVAFGDGMNYDRLTVRKYDGAKWVGVGQAGFTTAHAEATAIGCTSSGTLYVLFQDWNFVPKKASVKKFDGTSWVNVGTQGFSVGTVTNTDIAFDAAGTPYVSYLDGGSNNQLVVKKFDGSSWVDVGTGSVSAGSANYPRMEVDGSGNVYVVYADMSNNNYPTVKKFNGTSWSLVGTPVPVWFGGFDDIALDASGTPFICFSDPNAGQIATIMKFNGTSWASLGATATSGSAGETRMIIDGSGNPWIAFGDGASSARVSVKRYTGSAWAYVGSTVSRDLAERPGIAKDASGNIYATYMEDYNGHKCFVKKYNGTDWVFLGTPSITQTFASPSTMTIDAGNNVYVAYSDYINSSHVLVKKYDGTSWSTVGNYLPGLTGNAAAIAVNASGVPYVATNLSVAGVVFKFDATNSNWVSVGTEFSNLVPSPRMSMAFDNSGLPYVLFSDGNNSNKASVKKFDGTSWVDVGTQGFSLGAINRCVLKNDGLGNMYVAYTDFGSPTYSVMVKKFTGGSWVDVGNAGDASAGATLTEYPALAFDSKGTPFVAYQDGGNNLGAVTVRKFNGTTWDAVGGAGFFKYPMAKEIDVAIDSTGNPYVAFSDSFPMQPARVMKYTGTAWVDVNGGQASPGYAMNTQLTIKDGYAYLFYNSPDVFVKRTPTLPNTISVAGVKPIASLAIYPNPVAGGKLYLRMDDMPQGYYNASIYSMDGRLVQIATVQNDKSTTDHAMPLGALPKGTYVLKLAGNNKIAEQKFIIE